jgi:hypothetical protein
MMFISDKWIGAMPTKRLSEIDASSDTICVSDVAVAMPSAPLATDSARCKIRARRVRQLESVALLADGEDLRVDLVAGDQQELETMLGDPHADPDQKVAAVQLFGHVGALIVTAYEERWHRAHSGDTCEDDKNAQSLETLLDVFPSAPAPELDHLVAAFDRTSGFRGKATHPDQRWLGVTFAVSMRDATERAYRDYARAFVAYQ